MNHIDEGTIHAWLDGALDATESREIDVHVSQCSACAAAVAEARGLVAGASRILTALDDVPAGVTPKRVAPPPPARREWRAARWVTGIAAAFLLAIGITTWNRNAVRTELTSAPESAAAKVQAPAASAPSPQAAEREPRAEPVAVSTKAADEARDRKSLGATNVASLPRAVGGRVAEAQKEVARRDAARDLAGGRGEAAPGQVPAHPAETYRLSTDLANRARNVGNAAAPAPLPTAAAPKLEAAPAASAPAARVTAADTRARQMPADSTSVERLAGCYNVHTESLQKALQPSMPAAAAASGSKRSRAAPPAAPAARADFAQVGASMIVRLDTTRKRAGYVVFAATADSLIGFWTEIGRDSASVDLLVHGEVAIDRKNRVSCPER